MQVKFNKFVDPHIGQIVFAYLKRHKSLSPDPYKGLCLRVQ